MNITCMEIKDILLRPKIVMLKLLLVPFLIFVGFVIYAFLRGFGRNRYETINPAVIELGLPLWIILILALMLFVIINLIIKIYNTHSTEESAGIRLNNSMLVIDRPQYKMTFKLNKSQKFKISISRFWGFMYISFYRIGKLRIKYQGDSYTFLFPVRDMDLEQKIKNFNWQR